MLGYASPRALAAALRPSELGLWAALWQIDPPGEQRADLRMAILASVLANVNRDPKRRPEPFKPADFMPYVARGGEGDERDLSRRLRQALGNHGNRRARTP